MCNEAFVD